MINRYFKDGEKLDVAGLNEITVLLDRSETEITEIGWNCWTPQQDGPPHKHNDKDQIFYVTGGVGIIKLGDKEYPAEKGCLAYVPAGLVHQTITTTEEKLCYMLFNIFNTSNKEGHGTFAEHIEKVKNIRKQQAETGKTEIDDEVQLTQIKDHKYLTNVYNNSIESEDKLSSNIVLSRNETNNHELSLVHQSHKYKSMMRVHDDREQTLFVVSGEGLITVENDNEKIENGHLIYVPRNAPYSIETMSDELSYLCLSGFSLD